jgi:large repetitive protein
MRMQFKVSYGIASLGLISFLGICIPILAGQSVEPASATVRGVVISADTRQPIVGARVSVERGRYVDDSNARSEGPVATVLTDERGHFLAQKIKPGIYRLIAAKQGYLRSSFQVLELEPGKTTARDLVIDPLTKLSGRVLDNLNNPVNDAKVAALFDLAHPSISLHRLLSEQGRSVLVTTTGRQGEFALFVPHEEKGVNLVILAPGYAPSRLGLPLIRGGRERKGLVVRLSRGLDARGRVVDKDGKPISGATLVASHLGVNEAELELEYMRPRAMSGADGSFLLKGLEKGAYRLKGSRAGYATITVPEVDIRSQTANHIPDLVFLPASEIKGRITDTEGQPIIGARISGSSGEGNLSEQMSDIEGAFVLSGFVPEAGVMLSVDAAGYSKESRVVSAPNHNVVLVLSRHGILRGRVEDAVSRSPLSEFYIFGRERRGFRSEDGTFELRDLPAGRWTFAAQAPGYRAAEMTDIVINAGESTEGVVFSLAKGVELSGRIIDAKTGAGLPDINVSYLVATEVELPDWSSRSGWKREITDANGNFKFDGLPLGKIMIIATSPFHAEARRAVTAGEESFVEIKLSAGCSISGRVVGPDLISPLPSADVNLWDLASGSAVTIHADETGAFSYTGLKAGRYRLTASTKVGQTKPQEIALHENDRLKDLVLAVKAGATIRGRVVGLRANELPTVTIIVQGEGDFTSEEATDPSGTFTVQGVPEGLVELIAQTSSQRSISKSVRIPQGTADLSVNIEFPRAVRLSGRVTRAGQPVVRKIISANPRDPESAVSGFGETDQNGMYVIDGLSENDYLIDLGGEWTKAMPISGDTVLDIELSAFSLSGRILSADSEEPLPGVNVQLRSANSALDAGISRMATTDSLGRFLVEGVGMGQYKLIAHKHGFKVGMMAVSVPGSSEIIFSLSSAEGTAIRVRNGINGVGLRSITVNAISNGQLVPLNVALDESGQGELPQLTPGGYDLRISSPGYAPKSIRGWAAPGAPLDISLTPGGRLEVYADPIYIGLKASFLDADRALHPFMPTEFTLSKTVLFPHLAPGKYALLIKMPGQTKQYDVDIVEGQITTLQVK